MLPSRERDPLWSDDDLVPVGHQMNYEKSVTDEIRTFYLFFSNTCIELVIRQLYF